MNGELCSVCHKRIATVFITQIDNTGKQVNRGLCLVFREKNEASAGNAVFG